MPNDMRKSSHLLTGEVRDLTSELALLSPHDTPLTTLLYGMGKLVPATDITVSWRERELHTPAQITSNLQLEGAESPDAVKSTRTMKSNICQIMSKATSVSGTLQALNPLGIGDELASEVQDRLLELKRDMEYFFIRGAKAVEDGATPRQMDGLLNLVNATNVIDLAAADLTETKFIDAFQKMWEAGVVSENMYIFCGASEKRVINDLLKADTTKRIQVQPSQTTSLGILVDRIETDFGAGNIVLNRWMPSKTILIVDLNQVEIAQLRGTFYQELARTGDYIKGQVIAENTIKLLNSKAAAKIINMK